MIKSIVISKGSVFFGIVTIASIWMFKGQNNAIIGTIFFLIVTIIARSFHEEIPKEYLVRIKSCKTWEDIAIVLKKVILFLKR